MISNTLSKLQVTITSLPATVPITFPFQQIADILLLDSGATMNYDPPVTLVRGSDYTITGGGYDVNLNMLTGTATINSGGSGNVQIGDVITVMRSMPFNQLTSSVQAVLTAAGVEQALDRVVLYTQQLQEQLSRALQFENDETLSGILYYAQRLNNFLGFSGTGAVAYNSAAIPSASSSLNTGITAETGSGSQYLSSLNAAALSAGYVLFCVIGGAGGSFSGYQLVVSAAALGPGVVAALNQPTMRWLKVL